jgi:hypothetical protein
MMENALCGFHLLNGDLLSILSLEINCEMHEISGRFRQGESLILASMIPLPHVIP